jgi:hypothetical protein
VVYEPKVVAADELRGEIILYVLCRPALLRTYGPHYQMKSDPPVALRHWRIVRAWRDRFPAE